MQISLILGKGSTVEAESQEINYKKNDKFDYMLILINHL